MDTNFDVPDSTDWLGTPLSSLMPVEAAFRCHVCKDFFQSPMLTSYNHTFCSLCIRRALSVDGRCPLCRAAEQESKLRGNWALREAVDAFVASRPATLAVARTPPTVVQVVERSGKDFPDATPPKRKARQAVGDGAGNAPGMKRTRMSTRASKAKADHANAALLHQDEEEEEEVIPASPEPAPIAVDQKPDDGLVACPICQRRMKDWQVDRHIDSCLGEPQRPESNPPPTTQGNPLRENSNNSNNNKRSSNAFDTLSLSAAPPAPPPERLAPLNYSILRDNQLKKRLGEAGISTWGSRQLLERRHKEWVTLWNANCDSAQPKRRAELLHDLDVWERTIGNQAPSKTTAMGNQIRDKDFDGSAWATKHTGSFNDLIASARKSRHDAQAQAQARTKSEREAKEPDDSAPTEPGTRDTQNGHSSRPQPRPAASQVNGDGNAAAAALREIPNSPNLEPILPLPVSALAGTQPAMDLSSDRPPGPPSSSQPDASMSSDIGTRIS